jgi:hypothetical protein
MRTTTTAALLAASTAVGLAGSTAPAPAAPFEAAGAAESAPMAAAAASAAPNSSCPGDPLLGVVRGVGGRILAEIGRRTLRARPGLRVQLPDGVYGWSWASSPGCDAVAFGGPRGRVLLVGLERGRRMGGVSLGGRWPAGQIAWPRPDRVVGTTGSFEAPRVVTVSVPGGRVVASRRLEGRLWASEVTSFGLAILMAPGERIGSATLAVADSDGGLLRIPLPGIRAGFDEVNPRRLMGRQIVPGLAVDETAGRVYVVAANEPLVAEVDLASRAVSYHELRDDGADATAVAAKGLAYGAYRTARWLGDGTIAVAGEVIRTRPDWRRAARRGQPVTSTDPYGLRLIRTADWTATTLNPLLQSFTLAGPMLLGMNSDPLALDGARPTGLLAFGTDGRRRFVRFRGEARGWLRAVAWPYAYVRDLRPRRTYVVDLRTGRTVGEAGSRRPPVLLVR